MIHTRDEQVKDSLHDFEASLAASKSLLSADEGRLDTLRTTLQAACAQRELLDCESREVQDRVDSLEQECARMEEMNAEGRRVTDGQKQHTDVITAPRKGLKAQANMTRHDAEATRTRFVQTTLQATKRIVAQIQQSPPMTLQQLIHDRKVQIQNALARLEKTRKEVCSSTQLNGSCSEAHIWKNLTQEKEGLELQIQAIAAAAQVQSHARHRDELRVNLRQLSLQSTGADRLSHEAHRQHCIVLDQVSVLRCRNCDCLLGQDI